MTQCACGIPSECGTSHIGKTGRPLAMWFHEDRHNFKLVLLKSKLAEHANKEDHKVIWDEARILEIERNSK
jgi:hypothetical protein